MAPDLVQSPMLHESCGWNEKSSDDAARESGIGLLVFGGSDEL